MKSHSINITMATWNRVDLTRLCLERILATKLTNAIIHIIDNGSIDDTRQYLSHISKINDNVKVSFFNKNYGVSVAANYGWSLTDCDYYIKIDNDILVLDENWLDDLVSFSERNKEVGMLGYKLLENEKHKSTPVYLQSGDLFYEFPWCLGGIVLIPRKIHNQCGFWTEDYGCYGFEDIDYSNRVRIIGYRSGYHYNENAVKHLGYEADINPVQEKLKHACIHDVNKGEKLYLLNKFLFEEKIRDVKVPRKFLPIQNKSDISFKINREYSSITKIQNELIRKVKYTKDGDKVSFDFNLLKS